MLGAMRTLQRILVPVDFSPKADDVLEYAYLLAKPLGAAVTLLHVFEQPTAMSAIVPGVDPQIEYRTQANALLAPLLERLIGWGCAQATVLVEEGLAVETILKVASRDKFDVIAMATRGRTGFERVIMGSVAEGVLRQAPCAVLTVHFPLSTK